jgi:hypothetical protein
MSLSQEYPEQKRLPIKIHNETTTFLHFNFPLCTLLWNKNVLPWLVEHFIQLYTMMHNTDVGWVDMLEDDYFYCDVSDIVDLSSDDMADVTDMEHFIINKLHNDYYATIYTNEYYLPGRGAYQNYVNIHQTLLYGYDLKKRVFIGLGYDGRQRFMETEYPIDVFLKAYEEGKPHYKNDFCWVWMHTVYLNRVKNFTAPYQFRPEVFMKQLYNLIHSVEDKSKLRKDVVIEMGSDAKYGYSVYEDVLEYLYELRRGNFALDYRTAHILAEHKRGLYRKFNAMIAAHPQLSPAREYVETFKDIIDEFEKARLIYLRYELIDNDYQTIIGPLKNSGAIDRLIRIYDSVKDKERALVKKIYDIFGEYLLQ